MNPSAVLILLLLTKAALNLLSYMISDAVMVAVVKIVGEDYPMNLITFVFIIIIVLAFKLPSKWVVASTSTYMYEEDKAMPHTLPPPIHTDFNVNIYVQKNGLMISLSVSTLTHFSLPHLIENFVLGADPSSGLGVIIGSDMLENHPPIVLDMMQKTKNPPHYTTLFFFTMEESASPSFPPCAPPPFF